MRIVWIIIRTIAITGATLLVLSGTRLNPSHGSAAKIYLDHFLDKI